MTLPEKNRKEHKAWAIKPSGKHNKPTITRPVFAVFRTAAPYSTMYAYFIIELCMRFKYRNGTVTLSTQKKYRRAINRRDNWVSSMRFLHLVALYNPKSATWGWDSYPIIYLCCSSGFIFVSTWPQALKPWQPAPYILSQWWAQWAAPVCWLLPQLDGQVLSTARTSGGTFQNAGEMSRKKTDKNTDKKQTPQTPNRFCT